MLQITEQDCFMEMLDFYDFGINVMKYLGLSGKYKHSCLVI